MRFGLFRRGWRPPAALLLAAAALALTMLPRRWTDPARLAVLSVVNPLHRFSQKVVGFFRGGDAGRVGELQREVEFYRAQADVARTREDGWRRRCEAMARLPAAIGYSEEHRLAADVVLPSDVSLWRRSMVLACGAPDGVRVGDLVVWNDHLIGRLSEVGPFDARVQLVTSAGFKAVVGVIPPAGAAEGDLPRERQGVVEGLSDSRARLNWILNEEAAADGSLVVTMANPEGGVPPGLIVGRLRADGFDRQGYRKISVEPEIRHEALDAVVVLMRGNP